MNDLRRRSLPGLLLGIALLGLPVVSAGAATAAETYSTKTTIAVAPSAVQYKTSVSVSGTVGAYDTAGVQHDLTSAAHLVLLRRWNGTTTWTQIDSYDSWGSYYFTTTATRNATYQVAFAGGTQPNYDTGDPSDMDTLTASSASAGVKVARRLHDQLVQKSTVYLKGNVDPGWAHKPVFLERKTCSSCAWKTYAKQVTTSTGAWKFKLGAPRSGKWYWRAYVPKTTDYVKSLSDYSYYTQLL